MTNALEPHPLVWESRVRGSLLGIALGESLAFEQPDSGPLKAGSCTQMAAFTVEGTIRAALRSLHQGICHPPSVLWSAYCRWGVMQGLLPPGAIGLDGWLADVPPLRESRGDAPATVTALRENGAGSRDVPTGESLGWHSLVRSLPFAALSAQAHWSDVMMAADCAALTHGHPRAWSTAAAGVRLLNRLLAAPPGDPDLPGVVANALPGLDEEVAAGLRTALWAAGTRPGQREVLFSLASNAGAPAVLMGGVYAAASYPGPENMGRALRFAATARSREGVSAMAGAVLGALYGADAWPVGVLMRHELVWVLDTLARDLVRQLMDNPGGNADEAPADPLWLVRYPAW
ncbi:ADP-ribosylglycohydrolase family protein [Kineosporia sp. J2-2]|uniref:ADP-ribosylglycohydrolase family protein n=1 Tax=Kineosporia corallincola TaxID=2835133 RepID=A0ABS5TIP7_9ACTN|nr:ADP-ribosylglycohydrolase family protein [Kineosporia corallincola]MBT0770977.1 ADP-ribosylglycohydrolase family protein [Kineosporia corallincola]